MRLAAVKSALVLAVVAAGVTLSGATLSRQQADVLERKVAGITAPRVPGGMARRTPVTEDELNSWFAYRPESLPPGVTTPKVSLVGSGRVSAQAVVDLDVVGRRRSSGGLFDPWSLLSGRVPVTVTGTLQTRNGIGQFALESATLGGVPLPKPVLQELVSLYTRSARRPGGVDVDDPFVLPSSIRQIDIAPGQAVVLQ